jgi:hypothetical protein
MLRDAGPARCGPKGGRARKHGGVLSLARPDSWHEPDVTTVTDPDPHRNTLVVPLPARIPPPGGPAPVHIERPLPGLAVPIEMAKLAAICARASCLRTYTSATTRGGAAQAYNLGSDCAGAHGHLGIA